MNRCLSLRARIALAAFASLAALTPILLPAPAAAQGIQREAPKDVVLGQMAVGAPPEIQIDGKADRLSPGYRIRDLNNMLVLSASLAGQTVPVVYRRDAAGLVHEAWLLTAEEYRRLGGVGGGADGYRKFAELLSVIFGARR
ncbi:hypothetical protein GCM10027034_34390 [Ramlibacter solisilvae]|uniref:hypothetical protein n=1 Tax=Ramlibacter tataouinensis TaxID=94132 RepID=UPI000776CA9F|nr:hypothetical protein [Ramlibacter tataouinensis]